MPVGLFGLKRRIAHPFTKALGQNLEIIFLLTLTFPLAPDLPSPHLPSLSLHSSTLPQLLLCLYLTDTACCLQLSRSPPILPDSIPFNLSMINGDKL